MAGFVTYAQNFEDLMLWRALRGVKRGFYIDVGAADPRELSTTLAFYQRGWTGINIEPAPGYFSALEAARPHDLNLCCLLGSAAGSATFSHFAETGLSTTDPDVARQHVDLRGFQSETIERPVRTLSEICAQHVRGDIHFLKIDVEGAERDVLLGADFSRWRPWIVLVEATEPLSNVENWNGWEPLLLKADYRFVWFDGLNRFYIAAEHMTQHEAAFQTPPNVFDEWSLPSAPPATSDITGLQAAEEARQVADRLRGENEERRESAHAAREAAARSQAVAEEGRQVADRLRGENEERRESAHAAREAAARTQAVAEEGRQLADRLRGENEERRESAHASREAAAQLQALAEEARQLANRLHTEHEERRENAHALREAAAQTQAASETGRVLAENSRRAAEWERREAEEQRQAAEQSRQKPEPAYLPAAPHVSHVTTVPAEGPALAEASLNELRNLQATLRKLQLDHDALLKSSSWRITAPIRGGVQFFKTPVIFLRSRKDFGARLQRVGGVEAPFVKRAVRLGAYCTARVCAHLPGGRSAVQSLERITPKLHGWLTARYGAYRRSYLDSGDTPIPEPVPVAIISDIPPLVVSEPSTEEEIMLSRLRAWNQTVS